MDSMITFSENTRVMTISFFYY